LVVKKRQGSREQGSREAGEQGGEEFYGRLGCRIVVI
jgi:hypothetical protein